MRLYKARIMWYNEIEGESQTEHCIVFGKDLTEATMHINDSFKEIESLYIEEINAMTSGPILFIPDDIDFMNNIYDYNSY